MLLSRFTRKKYQLYMFPRKNESLRKEADVVEWKLVEISNAYDRGVHNFY